ncbi:nitroreductase/quinone reductase family protein [Kribbella turkmenica]|uniref:nitroreductase/quinone reductase family protein n=1 Tax=Kribbella turkmenica TaxID=2530375 RepID=UPI001F3365CD|nr:nitroreductase/quinone reductase family protein [Kribbella turkmenica]
MNDLVQQFRATAGQVDDGRYLLLTTTGARSGRPHTAILGYYPDGDRVLVVGSAGGGPKHPDWYHNLMANPEVTVETGLFTYPATAVARARERAGELAVEWVEGDAEELPFEDQRFDVVLSTFGCMFAPRHEVVADELARVLRPGGRLGLCTWTQNGVGDFFRALDGYFPPAPPFVDPPLAWGDEDHVRESFEGTRIELSIKREVFVIRHPSAEAAVDCYATAFGPVVLAREALGDRWPELRRDLFELFASRDATLPAEYLVIQGRRASRA